MKTLTFVISVYRNVETVRITYNRIKECISKQSIDYEFVFIDDGSDDGSWEEIVKIHEIDKKVKIILFSRNFGQLSAVVAGLKYSSGDAVINMSADLQEPVELIEQMIDEWNNGHEIVICNRVGRDDGIIANSASKLFYSMMKLSNPTMPKGGFDIFLLSRPVVNELNKIDERNRFFQGDILWLGFKVKLIPYERLKRPFGKSQWNLSKKLKYFIDGLLNTSYLPIRLMSLIGIMTAMVGFFYAVLITYYRIFHNAPFQGWAPIMILILIIGGLVMLMLGVIGEYVWRIYDETRKRPLYIIKDNIT